MSVSEVAPDGVDPLDQPVHPCRELAGYYDSIEEPDEYTICTREVADYTQWITADVGAVVRLEEVR